jgi:hypothetical protein
MIKLFTYADLQKPEIQIKIFGEEIPGTIDSISDWVVLNEFEKGNSYLQLASRPSGIVFGKILELTDEQVKKLDKYEKEYFRLTLKTDNGIMVEVYIRNNDKVKGQDNFYL